MATATKPSETIIELPREILDKLNGFAIDFGGSVIKVAYLSKEDWDTDGCKDSKNGQGKLRLISFIREELNECLEFIKTNCFVRRKSEDDRPLVYTCGLGGFQYGKKIEDTLNIRTQNENEWDSFKYALQYYLNNYPLETFCVKPLKEVQKAVLQEQKKMHSKMKQMLEEGHGVQNTRSKEGVEKIMEKEYDPTANTKPYILATFGSAWGCFRCCEDDMFENCGFAVFAGRSFLALGTLLTGAKTYDELMSLAEKGNNLKLDITFQDIGNEGEANVDKKEDADDVYSQLVNMIPRPIFLWGKAVGNELSNFRREDVARTLLYTMCQHLVQCAMTNMHLTRTKHIFVAGSFISHPLTQRIVTEEFEYLKWSRAMYFPGIDGDYHLHILEFGSHFGVIGSFMNGIKKTERRLRNEKEQKE